MKVLHLIKTSEGASWAFRQIAVLLSHGISVEVALPAPGPMSVAYEALGIPVHYMRTDIAELVNPWRFWKQRRALRRLVKLHKYDIIHSHFVGTTVFTRLALGRFGKTRRVFQVPGPLHLENWLTRTLELATAGPRDSWIASCKATRSAYLARGIDPARVGLAYYGIDFSTFLSGTRPDLRAQFGFGPQTRLIGMVAYIYGPKRWLGQRRGIKGHDDLIDAAHQLIRQGEDIACIFVGGPWKNAEAYAQALQRYAAEKLEGRAVFLGNRNDVSSLYLDFDVAVHPSHSENVGAAAESLPLEFPTIATNVGGFPDLVVHGVTGWLVPPKSPTALAATIQEVLADPAEAAQRALRGRELALTLFDVQSTGGDVLKFYRSLGQAEPLAHD